jgi:hypothetical protein
MQWLFAKLGWCWDNRARRATVGSFDEQLQAETPLVWHFRPDVTSLDQWMDLSA